MDANLAVEDCVEGIGILTATKNYFILLQKAEIRMYQKLSDLKSRQRRKYFQAIMNRIDQFRRGHRHPGACDLRLKQRLVRRWDCVPQDIFDRSEEHTSALQS